MTALVDHTRDHDLLIQGTQAACGWALHLLAGEKHRTTGRPLPTVTWLIDGTHPRLSGWADSPADVYAWADHLKAAATERNDAETVIQVHGIAHGVPVRIWARLTPITISEPPKAVA
jgi:hypothetical protein